jgi:heme/copper-type cytochrome/quinol oxidase subunit 3
MDSTNVRPRRITKLAEEGNLNRKFGFWIFLSSEFLIFYGLIAAFVITRANVWRQTESVEAFHKAWFELTPFSIALVSFNTFVLLASSLFVVLGIEAIRKNDSKALSKWLLLTVICGIVFLGGQAVEYTTLFGELAHHAEEIVKEGGTAPDSLMGFPFASAFFILTGFHGLHVFVGTLIAFGVWLRARKNVYFSGNYMTVEVFGLFWHFVDLVWVLIFTIVYLTSPIG